MRCRRAYRGGVGFLQVHARMTPVNLLAAQFEDPENARLIYLAAGGLVVVAILVVVGTVWWWRSAAVEHPSLGPLEVMGSRSWAKADDVERQQELDAVRPQGATQDDTSLIVPDPVDLLEADRERPIDFDDLAGDPEDDEWRQDTRPVRRPARVPMDPLLRGNDDY